MCVNTVNPDVKSFQQNFKQLKKIVEDPPHCRYFSSSWDAYAFRCVVCCSQHLHVILSSCSRKSYGPLQMSSFDEVRKAASGAVCIEVGSCLVGYPSHGGLC